MSGEENGGSGDRRTPDTVREVSAPFDPSASAAAATKVLRDLGVPFALIGGVGLDAWGITRATKDVDFAVPVGAAEKAAAALAAPGVQQRPLRIGGVAIRDSDRNLCIDLIDRRFHYGRLFADAIEEAQNQRRLAKVRDVEVPLVSLEYLLVMKLVSGDPKDDADVHRILRLQELDYRRAHALTEQHLGHATANRLETMARTAGRAEARREYSDE